VIPRNHQHSPHRVLGRRRVLEVGDCRTALGGGDLIDAALVTPTLKLRVEPHARDHLRKLHTDNPRAHREHVGIVVVARKHR